MQRAVSKDLPVLECNSRAVSKIASKICQFFDAAFTLLKRSASSWMQLARCFKDLPVLGCNLRTASEICRFLNATYALLQRCGSPSRLSVTIDERGRDN